MFLSMSFLLIYFLFNLFFVLNQNQNNQLRICKPTFLSLSRKVRDENLTKWTRFVANFKYQ